MRSIIRCAELRGPPTRQALALIAASEECEFLRIGLAHIGEPLCGKAERFIPFNLFELTGTAFPTRNSGFERRDGDVCCLMPAAPLPQITPLFTG